MAIEKKPYPKTVVDIPAPEICEVFVRQSVGQFPLSDFDGYGGQSPLEAAFELIAKNAQEKYGPRVVSEYSFELNQHAYAITVDTKMLDD